MPYVADSYTRAKAALDTIARDVTGAVQRRENGVAVILQQVNVLQNLASASPVGWLDTVNYIDAAAAANPTDESWQILKAQKDKLVSDFQAEKAKTQSIVDAINAV